MHERDTRCAGFTLVEVMIAGAIAVVLCGGVMLSLGSATRSFTTGARMQDIDTQARRAMDRICEMLMLSARATVSPQKFAPQSGTTLDFQRIKPGATGFGPTERIALQVNGDVEWTSNLGQPSQRVDVLARGIAATLEGETLGNGIDDNGNGLVDERGLALTIDGERVTVRFTMERFDGPTTRLVRTLERTVAFRHR